MHYSEYEFEPLRLEQMLARVEKGSSKEGAALVEKAFHFAEQAHSTQFRKSGEPYFIHPQFVASILIQLLIDPPMIAAALLHDTVEDCENVTLEQLEKEFGKQVAELVDGVTKLSKIDFGGKDISKDDVKKESLRKLLLAMSSDIRVVFIKLADRLHNMKTMQHQKEDRQKAIAQETIDIYAPLAHRIGLSTIKQELEDLSLRYLDPEGYYSVAEQLNATRIEREKRIRAILNELNDALWKENIECSTDGRPKSIFSIYNKMKKKHKDIHEIYDLYAVRVLVDTVADCYQVLGIVHSLWPNMEGRMKDYINNQKPNGYRSIHTTVMVQLKPEKRPAVLGVLPATAIAPRENEAADEADPPFPVEVQIRTYDMHRDAEYGLAAHWTYKEDGGRKDGKKDDRFKGLYSWIRQTLDLSEAAEDTNEFFEAFKEQLSDQDVIHVYTPRNEVKQLTVGATAIDFAYLIHSGVGNKCVGCKINGEIASLDTELQSNDRVEILTNPNSKGPSKDWLKIAKTKQARAKIRSFLKKANRPENIEMGRGMVEREIRRRGFRTGDVIRPEYCRGMLEKNNFREVDDLFNAVGYGDLRTEQVVNRLIEEYRAANPAPPRPEDAVRSDAGQRPERRANNGIYMSGNAGMDIPVRFGKCCSPVPGDNIVGFITRGRGVTVHKAECVNVRNGEKERQVDVEWAEDSNSAFATPINVTAYDETGLLLRLATVLSDRKIPIKAVSTTLNERMHTATLRFVVEVRSRQQANDLVKVLGQQPGVIEAIGVGQGS